MMDNCVLYMLSNSFFDLYESLFECKIEDQHCKSHIGDNDQGSSNITNILILKESFNFFDKKLDKMTLLCYNILCIK